MTKPIVNRSFPDKKALITSRGDITYTQLLSSIQQYANLFSGKSYTKVAIYAENSPEWIYACYAALQNNCIAIPIDFLASVEDVAYILDDCTPDLLFISSAMQDAYSKVAEKIQKEPEVLIFENIIPENTASESQWLGPESDDTTAVIIYTSGTTGSPKGVMLSYTNLRENMHAVIDCGIFEADRQVMIFLPLHHIFPLLGSMMVSFYVGTTVAMAPSM